MSMIEHLFRALQSVFGAPPRVRRRPRTVRKTASRTRRLVSRQGRHAGARGSRTKRREKISARRPVAKTATKGSKKTAATAVKKKVKKVVKKAVVRPVTKRPVKAAGHAAKKAAVRPPQVRAGSRSSGGAQKMLKSGRRPADQLRRTSNAAARDEGVFVGEITHYFSKIMVCVVKIEGASLLIHDQVHIKGATTDIRQAIRSMQIESRDVTVARSGQLVGLKVSRMVRVGDRVYKVSK